MKTEDKERVSEALNEKAHKIKVGWLTFKMKPLTLSQIYEMGAVAAMVDASDLKSKDKVNVISEMILHHNDAKAMQDVFLVCLFRSHLKRKLFRRYILKRLTVSKFQELINIISRSFEVNFFLTSIIFLSQTKAITEPNPTTALGQWSEE